MPLGPAAIDRAAALLEQARRDVTTIPELPEDVRPRDLADAYAIADRLDERLGWEIAGWYLGATNVAIQELLGLDGPYVARVYRRLLHSSPATLRADDFPPMVVECEFSFALRSELEPRPTPYSRAEVAAAVDSVHASIEVVAGHLEDWMRQDVWSVIADNGTDGAEIVGSGCALHEADLPAVPVTLEKNGEPVRHGSGADVLGDPFDAFCWLANERRAAGDGLHAGMRCNTGTATAICPVGRGDHLVATFGGVGVAELTIV